jgi:hypothetical protein
MEAEMPTVTLRNIPEELYEALKRRAERNRRSLNSEIIVCLEEAVRRQGVVTEELLARARQLREKTARYTITDDEFNTAKRAGRL